MGHFSMKIPSQLSAEINMQAFLDEFCSFPHGKFDDQVDSVVQFLAAVDTGDILIRADQARR